MKDLHHIKNFKCSSYVVCLVTFLSQLRMATMNLTQYEIVIATVTDMNYVYRNKIGVNSFQIYPYNYLITLHFQIRRKICFSD